MATLAELVVKITGDTAALKSALRDAENQASGFGNKIGGAIGKASLALGGLGVALGGAVGVVGIGFDNMRQQAQIAFETMLGSGEKAKSFLDELQAFAAKTPFEFPELIQASQRLLAMGFSAEDVLPSLTAIGDAVAGLGGGGEMIDRVSRALGQMKAKGKVSAEEMMQLAEAGIPAWQILADAIGVSIPEAMKMSEKGAISADTAIGALVDGMNAKFGGLMEKQSHTFGGLLSTLKDTFGIISGQVMAPFFDMAVKGMQRLADFTSSPRFTEGVQKFTDGIREGMEALRPHLEAVGRWLGEVIPRAIDDASRAFDAMRPGLEALGKVLKEGIAKGFEFLKAHPEAALGALVAVIGVLTAATVAWAAATIAATWPILAVIAAGAALGLAIKALIDHWDEIKAKTLEVWSTITDFLDEKFGWMRGAFETAFAAIKLVVDLVWKDIQTLFQFGLDTIANAFAFWKAIFSGDWDAAWEAVKDQFDTVWRLIKGIFTNHLTFLADAAKLGLAVLGDIIAGPAKGFNWIKDEVDKILVALKTFLESHWRDIVTIALAILFPPYGGLFWIATHFGEVKDAIMDVVSILGNWLSSAWGLMKETATSIFRAMKDSILGVFEGLKTGIRAALNWIIDRINDFVNSVNNVINAINAVPAVPNIPNIPNVPNLAAGIRNFRGGLAIIGEQGPELLALPRGSNVYSAGETRQMAAPGIGTTINIHGDIILPGVRDVDGFIRELGRRQELAARGVA